MAQDNTSATQEDTKLFLKDVPITAIEENLGRARAIIDSKCYSMPKSTVFQLIDDMQEYFGFNAVETAKLKAYWTTQQKEIRVKKALDAKKQDMHIKEEHAEPQFPNQMNLDNLSSILSLYPSVEVTQSDNTTTAYLENINNAEKVIFNHFENAPKSVLIKLIDTLLPDNYKLGNKGAKSLKAVVDERIFEPREAETQRVQAEEEKKAKEQAQKAKEQAKKEKEEAKIRQEEEAQKKREQEEQKKAEEKAQKEQKNQVTDIQISEIENGLSTSCKFDSHIYRIDTVFEGAETLGNLLYILTKG